MFRICHHYSPTESRTRWALSGHCQTPTFPHLSGSTSASRARLAPRTTHPFSIGRDFFRTRKRAESRALGHGTIKSPVADCRRKVGVRTSHPESAPSPKLHPLSAAAVATDTDCVNSPALAEHLQPVRGFQLPYADPRKPERKQRRRLRNYFDRRRRRARSKETCSSV